MASSAHFQISSCFPSAGWHAVEEGLERENKAGINFYGELIIPMGQILFDKLSQRPANANVVEATIFLSSQKDK